MVDGHLGIHVYLRRQMQGRELMREDLSKERMFKQYESCNNEKDCGRQWKKDVKSRN